LLAILLLGGGIGSRKTPARRFLSDAGNCRLHTSKKETIFYQVAFVNFVMRRDVLIE
jgi:hypothetical protein